MLSPFCKPITNLFVPVAPVVVSDLPPTCCALTVNVTAASTVSAVASMSAPVPVRSSAAAPPVLTTVRPVSPSVPPLAIVTDVVARSIVTPPATVTAARLVVGSSAVTTTLPAPDTVFPLRMEAAAVSVTPVFTVVLTAVPCVSLSSPPVKTTLSVTVTLDSALPLISLTFAVASAAPSVTASAPVPVLSTVSPATFLPAAVIVKPSPTVTTAPSSVPVKVPLPSNAAVVVVASRPLRSAFGVACSAVTATVPDPIAVFPDRLAAVP